MKNPGNMKQMLKNIGFVVAIIVITVSIWAIAFSTIANLTNQLFGLTQFCQAIGMAIAFSTPLIIFRAIDHRNKKLQDDKDKK